MTDKEKLIEIFKKIEYKPFPEMVSTANLANQFTDYALNSIVDQLLATDMFIPPCEIGDTVYYTDDFVKIIEKCKVYGFYFTNGKTSLCLDNGECKFVTSDWYATEKEAEEALERITK